MSSITSKSILIDACHPNGIDLHANIAQLLYGANPQHHRFDRVTVFKNKNNQIDWPEVDWLKLITVQDHPSDAENVISKAQLPELLSEHDESILLTLNSAVPSHHQNHVILSDRFVANNLQVQTKENFFNRLKNKVATTVTQHSFHHASSLIGFSCFTTSELAKLDRPYYSLPMGIRPEFYQSRTQHPTINQLTASNPFVWLASLTGDDVEPIITAIEAARILNNFGAYIQVRILMPESYDGTVLTTDAEKKIAEMCKGLGYAQIVSASDEHELAEHFTQANGFIWNYKTDKNHRDLLLAMANGLPIIAPRSEMVMKHTGNKLRFFIYNDSDDLASSLERSIADIHYRILSGSRNHRSSMAYTWEKTATELFTLLHAHSYASQDSLPIS